MRVPISSRKGSQGPFLEMHGQFYEEGFVMPKVNRIIVAPTIRKTSLGSTAAELGEYRIVAHDKQYSVTQTANSWHREKYIQSRGWIIVDTIPSDIQSKLLEALGV